MAKDIEYGRDSTRLQSKLVRPVSVSRTDLYSFGQDDG